MTWISDVDLREYLISQLDADVAREDFLVYVMGPYTTLDLDYLLEDGATVSDEVDFGAFDPDDDMETVLRLICSMLRQHAGVNAFIALDAEIPTYDEAANHPSLDRSDGVSVIKQSKRLADVSNAVVFVLPVGGIRDGVNIEIGSVLENNIIGADEANKDERYRIFKEKPIPSATLESLQEEYDVVVKEFETRNVLERELREFAFEIIGREVQGDLESL